VFPDVLQDRLVISSPATLTDVQKMTPASEITATSVVPPPMSTIRFPARLLNWQPGPDRRRDRPLDEIHVVRPACFAESRTPAVRTCVIPEGTPITTRGLRIVRSHRCVREMKVAQHPFGHLEVRDHSVFQRLNDRMLPGVRPSIALRFGPDGDDRVVTLVNRHDRGSLRTMPRLARTRAVFRRARSIARSSRMCATTSAL